MNSLEYKSYGIPDEFKPADREKKIIPACSRRDILKSALLCGAGICVLDPHRIVTTLRGNTQDVKVEASFYEKLPNRKIKCQLCPKECVIDDRERGYCGVRENSDGIYYTLVHSKPCSIAPDPIEKKPFFHFLPGTLAFSTATVGCNMDCKYCQNWQISQIRPEQSRNYDITPEQMVELAKEYDCPSIAYTYSEPVIFYEYMLDTAKVGQKQGVRNVMISNGYILPKPMQELLPYLDAVKIDLKAYTEKFYKEICDGELKPVLDAIKQIHKDGTWLEIVYLVVPTLNDSETELRGLSTWIYNEIGPDVPLHFSRFHPQYKLKNLPSTPVKTLQTAADIASDCGIKFVYIGNVAGDKRESTYCPECGKLLIRRVGYTILQHNIKNGKCNSCETPIPGVWS